MILCCSAAFACTTWAIVGKTVQSDGMIIAKNRDGSPNSIEKLVVFSPKKGIKYLALVYRPNSVKYQGYPFISAGINRAGVVVVNNAADTTKTQHRDLGETITMRNILAHYGSVAAVLKNQKKLFTTGLINNLLIADKHQIAVVEMGHDGQYDIKHKQQGYLFHTNTYEVAPLIKQNKVYLKDSVMRYHRIHQLLKNAKKPFSFQEVWNMANDRAEKITNDDILRPWTMATWIVDAPKTGASKLYVRFTDPSQSYNVYRLKLTPAFWQKPHIVGLYHQYLK